MWVCRAGKDALYIDKVKADGKIYLFWEGYKNDYSSIQDLKGFRNIVQTEKGEESKTSISNWAAQLYAFCKTIKKNDFVLIPYYKAHKYLLVKVIGDYTYQATEEYPHSRPVEIVREDIPKEIFPQDIIFSLNAFRTIYKVKNEERILQIINSKLEV